MNENEIKTLLSNFESTACMQLKYFLLKSIFPEATEDKILELGGFNAKSFSRIRSAVLSKSLPLLKFDNNQNLTIEEQQLRVKLEIACAEAAAAMSKVEELERALYEAQVQNENLTNVQSSDDVEEVAQLKQELAAVKAELEDVKGAHEFTRASMLDYQKSYVVELNAHQEAATEKHYYKYLLDRKGITIDEAELAKVLAGEVTVEQLKKKRTVAAKTPLYGFD